MDIKIVNKINYDNKSITTLVVGEQEYPLSEKELNSLVESLNNYRPDLLDEAFSLTEQAREKELLESRVESLEEDLQFANDRIDELEDELNELDED